MKGIVKVKIVLAAFFIIYIFFAGVDGFKWKTVHAQHIDVFNLDKSELPRKVQPSAPEAEWIAVEDHIRYEVVVDKSKYEAKDLTMADIELWEITDKSPFEWHQVDYYIEGEIREINTRTFGKQKCDRVRKGTLFWLKDGKKCVYWTKWTTWDCRPDGERDTATYIYPDDKP
ncbi:MAG: hypothetical protein ACE5H1_11270 [Thermodesulfobacteriota bacterium]